MVKKEDKLELRTKIKEYFENKGAMVKEEVYFDMRFQGRGIFSRVLRVDLLVTIIGKNFEEIESMNDSLWKNYKLINLGKSITDFYYVIESPFVIKKSIKLGKFAEIHPIEVIEWEKFFGTVDKFSLSSEN
ncbi:MAG: hypothetical protein ACFE9L_15300 [Candidatus Hodarchaeota archaeon]